MNVYVVIEVVQGLGDADTYENIHGIYTTRRAAEIAADECEAQDPDSYRAYIQIHPVND
jgi:hypothetical protein